MLQALLYKIAVKLLIIYQNRGVCGDFYFNRSNNIKQ